MPEPPEPEFAPAVLAQLRRLAQKYAADGQDLAAYLEGLYHARYVTYWDYIELDTLLSLQRPLTARPDEQIFILYHQITELYFKLCLHEYEQLGQLAAPTLAEVLRRVGRVNRYFENLIDSFDVMVDGLDKAQFLEFRLALMPASGFQSVQYRLIEIASTSLDNLVDQEKRRLLGEAAATDALLGCLYWKAGATVEANRRQGSHADAVRREVHRPAHCLRRRVPGPQPLARGAAPAPRRPAGTAPAARPAPARRERERQLAADALQIGRALNLQQGPAARPATGGTNWRHYLPPRFQRRIFYPQLWSAAELADWGKGWVEEVLGAPAMEPR